MRYAKLGVNAGQWKVVSDRPCYGGGYNALRNICPYRTGPRKSGRVLPLVLPDGLTGMTYTREGEIIKCPWHQWEFDIKTG